MATTKRKKKIKTLTIVGRRWFNRTFGNTYHSAEIHINGEAVGGVEYAYGYGDQYLYNAMAWLHKNGYLDKQPMEERPDGHPPEAAWRWAERHGVKFSYSVTDVQRKKDL